MNKDLRKSIMTWTLLINKYRKKNNVGNPFAYEKQRKYLNKDFQKIFKGFLQ